MENIEIAFNLTSTDYSAELSFSVVLNDKTVVDIDHVDKETPIKFTIDVEDGDHELKFIMKNKIMDHTTVDENGQIVKDACLTIQDFSIDDIELNYGFVENTIYHHDFNGTQDPIEDEFYGDMGCNGTVILKFSSPVYLWMLETVI